MLARYLPDHMPGKPNVIVQSMPGAGSIKAANYVYTVAPKDGTTLGVFSVGALIDELFGMSTTSFDSTKFGWIGNMDESVGVCVVKSAAGVRQVRGPAAEGDAVRRHRPVRRRDAGGDRAHAALRREDQADQGLSRRAGRGAGDGPRRGAGRLRHHHRGAQEPARAQIKSGELVPIIHDAMKPHPELPGVPSVYDFAKTRRRPPGARSAVRLARARPSDRGAARHSRRAACCAAQGVHGRDDRPALHRRRATSPSSTSRPRRASEVASLIARLFSHSKETIARAADAVRN